jgi:hypothetical protein
MRTTKDALFLSMYSAERKPNSGNVHTCSQPSAVNVADLQRRLQGLYFRYKSTIGFVVVPLFLELLSNVTI